MGKIRIGLIGAGMIAESAHVPSLLKSDLIEFAVIIDSNLQRAELLNEKFGINIPVIADLNELNGKIDAAIVCTPNDSHSDICLSCFDLGIHVLVEKPLANTYEESVELIERAKDKNCILMVGYCTRFWPSVQYVKDIIAHNVLGEAKRFVFQYGSAGGWAP
ncbi:MAG TPA: Gfo/Idh/MocA family oxidoreductase, partial [Candidatus Babeliaceae bacterium]|nr:Gfo/Idh/MocA family oxidoreductase [Candidatus Babeliaceae bacterium]